MHSMSGVVSALALWIELEQTMYLNRIHAAARKARRRKKPKPKTQKINTAKRQGRGDEKSSGSHHLYRIG